MVVKEGHDTNMHQNKSSSHFFYPLFPLIVELYASR